MCKKEVWVNNTHFIDFCTFPFNFIGSERKCLSFKYTNNYNLEKLVATVSEFWDMIPLFVQKHSWVTC